MGAVILSYEDPSQMFASQNLALMIFSQTPVAPLAMSAFVLRRPFGQLIVFQGLCTFVTLPWILSLQAACKSDASITAAVHKLGGLLEQLLFPLISASGDDKNLDYIWWQVGVFFHILYGFVLPISVLYMSEVWTRVLFVKRKKQNTRSPQFSNVFLESLGGVGFMTIVLLQVVWAILVELQEW